MRAQILILFTLFLTGCAVWPIAPPPQAAVPPTPDPNRLSGPAAPIPAAGVNPRNDVDERPAYGLSLGFDAIPPIYDPQFVPASEAPLAADELVIGAAWGGEAKAYPVLVLNLHEMVNDELAGVPTLVTW